MALVADSFNTVYRVSSGSDTYLLRVGPAQTIHSADGSRAELSWLRDLAGRGLPVPRIIPARDGAASVHVSVPGVPGRRECALLSWRPGRAVARPVSHDDIVDLAVLAAELHEASPPTVVQPVGSLDGRRVLHFVIPDRLAEAPTPYRDVLGTARQRAQNRVDELWETAPEPPRLVHSDLTPNNVLRGRGRLAPIDFQDMTWGHLAQDIASTLFGITRGEGVELALAAFRSGYERIRPWPDVTLGQLPDLFAARRLEMVNLAITLGRPGLDEYVARHARALSVDEW